MLSSLQLRSHILSISSVFITQNQYLFKCRNNIASIRSQQITKIALLNLIKQSTHQHSLLPNVIPVHRSNDNNKKGVVNVVGDTHGEFGEFELVFGKKVYEIPSKK